MYGLNTLKQCTNKNLLLFLLYLLSFQYWDFMCSKCYIYIASTLIWLANLIIVYNKRILGKVLYFLLCSTHQTTQFNSQLMKVDGRLRHLQWTQFPTLQQWSWTAQSLSRPSRTRHYYGHWPSAKGTTTVNKMTRMKANASQVSQNTHTHTKGEKGGNSY